MIGTLVGLLLLASGSQPSARPPTPAPVSDAITVIWCGSVLGESIDVAGERLGGPEAKIETNRHGLVFWRYRVDDGTATCDLGVAEGRVIEILASATSDKADPRMLDPYGVSLGLPTRDLYVLRREPLSEIDEELTYPSASGACWSYGFYLHRVNKIRVWLNLNNRQLDCHAR
jgi:hypothetical protein